MPLFTPNVKQLKKYAIELQINKRDVDSSFARIMFIICMHSFSKFVRKHCSFVTCYINIFNKISLNVDSDFYVIMHVTLENNLVHNAETNSDCFSQIVPVSIDEGWIK